MNKNLRSGWGRTSTTSTPIFEVDQLLKKELRDLGESGLPIGLGRSYGDSSLNSAGVSWTCEGKKRIQVDTSLSAAICDAGVTIGELERAAAIHGLFPPVVPGTEFVTIGGAIASDVHGKSHHSYGSFGTQILEISLVDSQGNLRILKPTGLESEIFWATVGGMGLTGIVVSAKIKLVRIETVFFECKEVRVQNLSEALEELKKFDEEFAYTVAWIDFSGKFTGRGLVSGGNHATLSQLNPKLVSEPLLKKMPKNISLPDIFPSNFINKFTVRLFNEIWYRKPLAEGIKHFQKFLHPLDSIQNWNRIYGKNGFLQYQFQVPEIHEAFLFTVLKKFKSINASSFLAVLKKFGSANSGFLSFPDAGWTLSIDVPARLKGLENCLAELDAELTLLGGKIYLAKDQRLSRENFEKMYPKNQEWKQIKNKVDPENYWGSDQGRRLGLC